MRILLLTFAGLLAAVFLSNAGGADLTDQELLAGRKLYVSKCAKCHRFYEAKNYSGSEWDHWMSSMSRKAKLKPEQEQLLTRYLQAYREGKIPTDR